jgi:Protein of unknown function (DUF3631)
LGAAGDAEPSLGIRLLADLRSVCVGHNALSTKAILRALVDLEEAPWGDLKGKVLDERGLARRLRQYGVKSKQIRFSDDLTLKGYGREDLHDVWERYLPPLSPGGSETSETSATRTDFVTEVAAAAPETCDHECETSETSARSVSDVSDDISDHFASGNGIKPTKSTAVPNVSDVSLPPANGGGDRPQLP